MAKRSLPVGVVGEFTGLDLRRDAAMSSQQSLRVASNVDLLVGGNVKRRDALVKVCDVHSSTVGLYAAEGLLRTVCPGGQSLQDTRPTEIWYDPVGDGSAYGLTSLSAFHAIENVSAAAGGKSYPYVVIERDTGRIEHHWLNSDPASSAAAVNTKVVLPFDPGKTLAKSYGKLYADDPSAGVLRYSATTTDPTDWNKKRDAGFLAIRQFSAGSQEVKGLSYFKSFVAVVFQDSIQLWQMNEDPAKIQFISALNGPGTETPRLTSNVLGDLFYFSRGGFRSLARNMVTGDDVAEDLGAPIAELTESQDITTNLPVGLWCESRSQYLAAFGTKVYALTYSPSTGTTGWTTWDLGVPVEHMAENLGVLYVRSGDTVYKFNPDAVLDDGDDQVIFDVFLAYQHYGKPGIKKHWRWFDVVQTGTSQINFAIDANDPTDLELATGINTTDTTFSKGHIAINRTCDALGLKFGGTGLWRLDSVILDARVLGGRG